MRDDRRQLRRIDLSPACARCAAPCEEDDRDRRVPPSGYQKISSLAPAQMNRVIAFGALRVESRGDRAGKSLLVARSEDADDGPFAELSVIDRDLATIMAVDLGDRLKERLAVEGQHAVPPGEAALYLRCADGLDLDALAGSHHRALIGRDPLPRGRPVEIRVGHLDDTLCHSHVHIVAHRAYGEHRAQCTHEHTPGSNDERSRCILGNLEEPLPTNELNLAKLCVEMHHRAGGRVQEHARAVGERHAADLSHIAHVDLSMAAQIPPTPTASGYDGRSESRRQKPPAAWRRATAQCES